MTGPDHKASINPKQFKAMVKGIRQTEEMLGNGKKIPTKSELKNKLIVRKSIVARTDIKKGDNTSIRNHPLVIEKIHEGYEPGLPRS